MSDRAKVGDIVGTHGASVGVVIGKTADVPYEEYRVQLIDITQASEASERVYTAGYVGLYNADQIVPLGYCENDSEQAHILCAASGIAFHDALARTNC